MQQAAALRTYWAGAHVEVRREKKNQRGRMRTIEYLVARGKLSATSITGEYDVRIEYRYEKNPTAFVEYPQLARRPSDPDTAIPHTYDSHLPGHEKPCLFLPGVDWDATMPIAKTIVPWFRCWLFDYELWHATGNWTGGGRHPSPATDAETTT